MGPSVQVRRTHVSRRSGRMIAVLAAALSLARATFAAGQEQPAPTETPAVVTSSPTTTEVPGASISASAEVLTSGTSPRSYAADWLVNPDRELEVSSNLRLLTAPDGPFAGRALRLTDVGLFGAHARYTTGGLFEFDGG